MSAGRPGYIVNPITGAFQFLGQYRKPNYKWSDNNRIVVPASSTKPVYYVLGGQVYRVASSLYMNATTSGVGGLRSGVSLEANKPYYLYAVKNGETVGIVGDVNDPDTGPQGFTPWSYVGAFATATGSATITAFQAVNGLYMANDEIENESNSAASRVSATFESLPTTAIIMLAQIAISGTQADASGLASGKDAGDDAILDHLQVTGVDTFNQGMIPIFTTQTIYITNGHANNTTIIQMYGWREDPSEWV